MQTPPDSPQLSGSSCSDPRIGLVIADSIQLVKVLGIGAYGTVYQAHHVITGDIYAVKALNKLGLDVRQQRFQKREVELHYRASCHPNVLSMYRIIDSEDCTYVVLEYCPEGDLFAKITEEGHYVRDDTKARSIFLQLLRAVQYCHSINIYHRDLKPENVMVADNGSSVRLAGVGLATKESISRDFGCGSTFYMSPECQEVNPRPSSWYRSSANDIWSLGVILVNLTCGRNPWKRACSDDSTFRAYQRDRNFLKTILPIHDELNTILQRIFELDPAKRITLPELIQRMEQNPRLTLEVPLSPPDSPVETIVDTPYVDVDCQMADDNLQTMPALKLPSPRYPAPQTNLYYPAIYPNMPGSTPPHSASSTPGHGPFVGQARSHYDYASQALAFTQQFWQWHQCAQQVVYPYPSTYVY